MPIPISILISECHISGLNTDSSVVKFPEIQYICTMTDFTYNMDTQDSEYGTKRKIKHPSSSSLINLLKLDFAKLDKPTFFATNNLSDTVAFSSWKGSYHLDQEYIEAENINYIHIADALIQPDSGKIIINRRAKIQQMQNAIIAVNNKHILHSAKIDIESQKDIQEVLFMIILMKIKRSSRSIFLNWLLIHATTYARGYIPGISEFHA